MTVVQVNRGRQRNRRGSGRRRGEPGGGERRRGFSRVAAADEGQGRKGGGVTEHDRSKLMRMTLLSLKVD